MKERPILFAGEMVRAILEGRKTQTRRVIKELVSCSQRDAEGWPHPHDPMIWHNSCWLKPNEWSPYGVPGDRLWVRENFMIQVKPCAMYPKGEVEYAADYPPQSGPVFQYEDGSSALRPSIFMPRLASRITLEIVNIRVQRVQDISGEDAKVEGWPSHLVLFPTVNEGYKARTWYREIWDSLNAKRGYSWESNPWVWVIEFKVVTP